MRRYLLWENPSVWVSCCCCNKLSLIWSFEQYKLILFSHVGWKILTWVSSGLKGKCEQVMFSSGSSRGGGSPGLFHLLETIPFFHLQSQQSQNSLLCCHFSGSVQPEKVLCEDLRGSDSAHPHNPESTHLKALNLNHICKSSCKVREQFLGLRVCPDHYSIYIGSF